MTSASPSRQLVHPAVLHATLQARADELAARKAERQEARSRRARSRGGRGAIAVFGAASLLMVGALSVLAVHDAGVFELDADAVAEPGIGIGLAGDDWDLVEAGTDSAVVSQFVTDPFEGDDDVFAQDSADIDDITEWHWKTAEPEDKNDITNAYAAAYVATSGPDAGDLILYFGVDRMANNGDAAVGVWFVQDEVSQTGPCQGPNCEFEGAHVAGDILVQSDFTTGGTVERLDVYMWDCDTFYGSAAACDSAFPFAVDNVGGDLWKIFEGVDCDAALGGDLACAQVNTTAVTAPWDYSYKCVGTNQPAECAGHNGQIVALDVFPVATFFEGGVNLTDTLGSDICVATFIAETRSSQSETSTLDDKALGGFDLCGNKSGTKFEDLDGDGVKDGGEPGLDGWTINLWADDGDTVGVLDVNDTWLDDAVTGDGDWADGYYEFPNLQAGAYIVCEESMTGWVQTFPNAVAGEVIDTCDDFDDPDSDAQEEFGYKFTIVGGVDNTGNDFGNFEEITKSGIKYEDPNGDGDLTDGVAADGWTINLYADDGGTAGALDATDTWLDDAVTGSGTWADGYYEFPDLGPGTYIVCEESMTGWVQTFPNAVAGEVIDSCDAVAGQEEFGYLFTAASGEDETGNDFGNFEEITKSGFKFNDNDTDGVYEPAPDPQNDTQLTGWVIELWKLNGTWSFVASYTTDVTGYSFSDLGPGTYAVCEVIQPDWVQSFPYSGATLSDGETVFDCTQLTPDGGGTFAPFGYQFTTESGTDLDENIFGNFLVPPGCSLTQGYWKTHSDRGPAPYDADGWGALGDFDGDGVEEEEGEAFFDSGLTWYQVFWTSPKNGNAYFILAHQYMAAVLNEANGAGNPTGLADALADAETLLDFYDDAPYNNSIPKNADFVLDAGVKDRAEAIAIAGFLASYNEGTLPGTSHCGEAGFTGFTTLAGLTGGFVWPIAVATLVAAIARRRRD